MTAAPPPNADYGWLNAGELHEPPNATPNADTGGRYDRKVLVEVLIYHWPTNTSGCGCGWAELGHSHAEHVADVYEASVAHNGSYGAPS